MFKIYNEMEQIYATLGLSRTIETIYKNATFLTNSEKKIGEHWALHCHALWGLCLTLRVFCLALGVFALHWVRDLCLGHFPLFLSLLISLLFSPLF